MPVIALEKHLPRLFLDQLDSFEDAEPFAVRVPAAVMMSDVSGFSALTRELTRDSVRGAEALQEILDGYFGTLGEIVAQHGGDIATFAGDAVIAVWPAHDNMQTAVRLATQCALWIQEETRSRENGKAAGFTQRIGVSCGELIVCKLGGVEGKWLNVFAGQPIVDAGHACDIAKAGSVLVTAEVADLFEAKITGSAFGDGYTLIEAVREAVAPAASTPANPSRNLAPYVPDVIVRRMNSGQDEWLAEFRSVTMMFVKLEGIDFASERLGSSLQQMARTIQETVQRFGGALPFALMDDKGLNFVVAFGIPTATYEDDAARALATGLEIQSALRRSGLKPSIGVATGTLYCGECGAKARRQYSMIGPAINFAARLAGASPDDLISDEETSKAAGERFSFTLAKNVRPKNTDAGYLTFRPEWRTKSRAVERGSAMVGRDTELKLLVEALERARAGRSARLLVGGEPGIGKSRLLRELREQAAALGFAVIGGDCQSLEQNTPYFVWREILRSVLARLTAAGETWPDTVRRQLDDEPQLLSWAPLLNDILPLALAETALTIEIRGAARASSIQALLLRLIERAGSPMVLIVDDLHWIDGLSGSALALIAERLPALSVVVGSRPAGDNPGAAEVSRIAGLQNVTLGVLDEAQTGEIVSHVCGVASITPELAHLIHGRAGGNPFYIQQLTLELRESGHVEVVGGRCKLHADIAEHIAHALPKTLRGVVTSRVDRLKDDEQLVLKLACVYGRVFSEDALAAIHPVAGESGRIGLLLAGMLGSNLIAREETTRYAFTHAIVQETLYELLPLAQRKRLHLRIADWLEEQHGTMLAGVYGPLANHCLLAEQYPRALNHLEGAAKNAIRHSAYREAISYIQNAQGIVAEQAMSIGAERRARWHSLLGDSHHELSEYNQARDHYLKALELLGLRYAPGGFARATGIALNLAKLFLSDGTPRADATSQPGGLAAHACARLGEIYYHENNPLTVLHLTLLSVNRAQNAGSVPDLAAGYGALAIAFGQMGLAGAGQRYTKRGIQLAESLSGNVGGAAYAHLLAEVYASSQCNWPILDESGRRAEALFADLGDGFRLASARAMLVTAEIQRGHYDEATAINERALAQGMTSERVTGWLLSNRILTAIARNEPARSDIEQLARAGANVESLIDRMFFLGAQASGWWRLGEPARALNAAEQGLALLLGHSPVAGAGYVDGPLGVIEVMLGLSDRVEPELAAAHAARTAEACATLKTYARQVPSTRPRGFFLLAVHAEQTGARRRAMALWQRAATEAKRLSMPYHQAAALLALGQRSPAHRKDLDEAHALFASLGVPVPTQFTPPGRS